MNHQALIALGANVGDPQATLQRSITALRDHPRITLVARSRFYRSAAVTGSDESQERSYLNGAVRVTTTADCETLLRICQEIETQLGRARTERWGPRTIDLDLLLFDDAIINRAPDLIIPHPRMTWRRFVLAPAAEIAPEMVHPTSGRTVAQLAAHLDNTPLYVAIYGGSTAQRTALAREIADRHAGRFLPDPGRSGLQAESRVESGDRRRALLDRSDPPWRDETRLTVTDFRAEPADGPDVVKPRLVVRIGEAEPAGARASTEYAPTVWLTDPLDQEQLTELWAAIQGIRKVDREGRPVVVAV